MAAINAEHDSDDLLQQLIDFAVKIKPILLQRITSTRNKLLQACEKIKLLESENTRLDTVRADLVQELDLERQSTKILLAEKNKLEFTLQAKESDVDGLKEKLLQSKKLYEQISNQMTSLKRNIAVSRTRLHNRGDIENFNTRIEGLLACAKLGAQETEHDFKAECKKEKEELTDAECEVTKSSISRNDIHVSLNITTELEIENRERSMIVDGANSTVGNIAAEEVQASPKSCSASQNSPILDFVSKYNRDRNSAEESAVSTILFKASNQARGKYSGSTNEKSGLADALQLVQDSGRVHSKSLSRNSLLKLQPESNLTFSSVHRDKGTQLDSRQHKRQKKFLDDSTISEDKLKSGNESSRVSSIFSNSGGRRMVCGEQFETGTSHSSNCNHDVGVKQVALYAALSNVVT